MMPLFPKLLLDFGREFIWSPLTLSAKHQKNANKYHDIRCELNSTFYCEENVGKGSRCDEDSCTKLCFDAYCERNTVRDLTLTENNKKSCLVLTCEHYPNCDHNKDNNIDTKSSEITFYSTNSSAVRRFVRSLSAPNLNFSSDSNVNQIANRIDDAYGASDANKSLSLTSSRVTADSDESVITDLIERLHRIDHCTNICDASVKNHCLDNNVVSSECQLSVNDYSDRCIADGFVVELTEKFATMSSSLRSDNDNLEANSKVKPQRRKVAVCDKKLMDCVVLNDYFDNSNKSDDQRKDNNISPNSADTKKTSLSRHNSRRHLTDKRLRNVVIDRIKRLARSQSHGRSDGISSHFTNLGSRAIVLRTKGLYRHVKRRFSTVHSSCFDEEMRAIAFDEPCLTSCSNASFNNTIERMASLRDSCDSTVILRHCSSFESLVDSGCGSSIQTSSLSTDSNRSSICTTDDVNGLVYRGPFISHAKAITDYTPCPYYKDALAYKRGDIINIISKNDSGTWIGMANGKIGHFKFINVEEIRGIDKRKPNCKLNAAFLASIQTEVHAEINDSDFSDERTDASIYYKLKTQLGKTNDSLTLTNMLQLIGLYDCGYLDILMSNGINDLMSFAKEVSSKDMLNDIGISDTRSQEILLKAAQIIRYNNNYSCSDCCSSYSKPTSLKSNSSHIFYGKRRELFTQSAPTTPQIEFSADFSELISKLESVNIESESSLENNNYNNYDEIQHYSSCAANLRTQKNAHSSVEEFSNLKEKYREEHNSEYNGQTIYENNDQILVVTHDQTNNNSCLDAPKTPINKNQIRTNKNKSSVHFGIRDKSLDRNLLRKLDLKPVYTNNRNPLETTTRGISSSQSVFDLRTSFANNENADKSQDSSLVPIDTLTNKKKIKKFISSSKKFPTFTSHSSLQSLANSNNNGAPNAAKIICDTLLEALQLKLESENINLSEEPYSDSAGFCGIPPALISRYADECERDTYEIAEALDHLRMQSLMKLGKRGIPNDYLGDSCVGPVIDLANYENLHHWLISIGLPMYENCLRALKYDTLYRVSKLRESDIINKCAILDRRHIRILTNAIGALHLSLGDIGEAN